MNGHYANQTEENRLGSSKNETLQIQEFVHVMQATYYNLYLLHIRTSQNKIEALAWHTPQFSRPPLTHDVGHNNLFIALTLETTQVAEAQPEPICMHVSNAQ